MNLWFCVSIISFIFYFTKIKQSHGNQQLSKWFLRDEHLYYIDMEAKYTYQETEEICIRNNMVSELQLEETQPLLEQLNKINGNFTTFWLLGNQSDDKKCLKFTGKTFFTTILCTDLLGLVCKTHIAGATVGYKNGTEHEIDINDVRLSKYCDPQSDENDDVLEYCILHYFLLLL